jgi:hypothetical protein
LWIAEATDTEQPDAHHLASVDWFHRLKRVAGRAQSLKGHCDVCAALLNWSWYPRENTVGQVCRRLVALCGP